MSCEGPIVSVHPSPAPSPGHVHMHSGLMSSGTPPPRRVYNKSLLNAAGRDRAQSIGLQPDAFLTPLSASHPSSQGGGGLSVLRSRSLPRGVHVEDSAELSLPVGGVSHPRSPAAGSGRFMRRAETIDTDKIQKEEFEEYTKVNQYKVLDIIGHGSYGIVRKATDDHDDVYAMKIVGKRRLRRKSFPVRPRPGMKGPRELKSPLNDIQKEIAILKKLDHPNVVRLYEVLDDACEDDLILVFEYISNGTVLPSLPLEKVLSEDKAREYFIDLILGLEYLHSQHIIHRDIKPDNLLLDDNDRIKIADFGVSEEIDTSDSRLSRSAGTPAFLSPECLDASSKSYQGQGVDIWAAGITLYCFIFGKVPWSSQYITGLHEKIQREDLPMPESVSISPELRDLLHKLLEKKPMKRITIPEIRKHPWILKTSRVMPSREENCREEISVSEEEIKGAFKAFRTPIHILVMVKQMAKRRSLSRPFSSSPTNSPRTSPKRAPTSPLAVDHQLDQSMRGLSHPVSGRREALLKSRNNPSICVDSVDDPL